MLLILDRTYSGEQGPCAHSYSLPRSGISNIIKVPPQSIQDHFQILLSITSPSSSRLCYHLQKHIGVNHGDTRQYSEVRSENLTRGFIVIKCSDGVLEDPSVEESMGEGRERGSANEEEDGREDSVELVDREFGNCQGFVQSRAECWAVGLGSAFGVS
jgi:hypothetical protein